MTTINDFYDKMSDNLKENTIISFVRRGSVMETAGNSKLLDEISTDEPLSYLEKILNDKQFERIVLKNPIFKMDKAENFGLVIYLLVFDEYFDETMKILGEK